MGTFVENVNLVATGIQEVYDNLAEILLADDNAVICTAMAEVCTSTYDQFDDRYLGAKATPPLVDNDGNGVDFTAVTATNITLTSPAALNDVVDIICYAVFELSTAPTKDVVAYTVSTVADLASVPSSYTTAIVKDLDRGGTFIWSSTGTANGGTVFAGATGFWTRQYSGAVNVKWFGAKGDGVTDDTVAIKLLFSFINQDIFSTTLGTWIGTTPPIGEIPTVELNAEDIYLISDTIVISTNVNIKGNGASFIMSSAGVGKDMLFIDYNFNGSGVTSYGNYFNTIDNLKIGGKGYARTGIVFELCQWSVFSNIKITGCKYNDGVYGTTRSYGAKLLNCQYCSFTAFDSSENSNGIHFGANLSDAISFCIDLAFSDCMIDKNDVYGIHISGLKKSHFKKIDISRNKGTAVKYDSDNLDGTSNTSAVNGNIFDMLTAEYSADDEPSSGYVMDFGNSLNFYSNTFSNFEYQPQQGSVVTRFAYAKIMRNGGKWNSISNLIYLADNIVENPLVSGDYSMFVSINFDGLRVNLTSWTPAITFAEKLCVDGSGVLIGVGDTRFTLNIVGSYQYHSSSNKRISGVGTTKKDEWYLSGYSAPMMVIDGQGGVNFGDGTTAYGTIPRMRNFSGYIMAERGDLGTLGGAWNQSHFRLGTTHLWVDSLGKLRIKSGAPTSDTDGTIVGTQT
jgi:hypothetical protein